MTDHVYKLRKDDSDEYGPIGLMLREPKVQTNRGRMSATVTLSREAEDRSGDIVVLKGLRTDGHKKNPVCLLNHNKEHVVGYCQDALGAYTVKTHGDKLVGEVFFCQDSQLGQDTFRAVEAKILRGTSIGFLPMVGKVEKRNQRGTIYHGTDLIEVTITPIGDNEDAVIEAVHKTFGAKPPCAELAPYLPGLGHRPKFVVSGYNAAGERLDMVASTTGTTHSVKVSKAMVAPVKPRDPNAMAPAAAPPDPTATDPADEFMPPADDALDPNDPNAAVDPHADHKAVVDDASENVAASIFDKFTSGQLDRKAALKLFDKILRHHEDVANIGGGDEDLDADDETDETGVDDDDGFGDAESFDETDSDTDGDGDIDSADDKPDLKDKARERAEKAVGEMWTKSYAPILTSVFNAIGHVVREPDLDPQSAQAYLRKQLKRLQGLPQVDKQIKKALADQDSPWAEWETTFVTKNGVH